ncbi:TonB-dependent siderophore receptor [Tolypothrix sp. VBCCA 56010]|uniref:TonB-dependent siderophore receptor n=1 Tax=Tolypothrix sp. VBCCA 56010 TaxID=3137731 RepID=UPI003D7F00B0
MDSMRQGYIHNVRLTTLMLRVAQFSLGMAVTLLFTSTAWAEAGTQKAENQQQQPPVKATGDWVINRNKLKPISTPKILQLSEMERPHTSAQMLLGQSPAVPNTPSQEIVQVTGVKANPTDKGVEVILQTTGGKQLQVVNRSTGNSFIVDIPNAQLRLPSGEAFTFRSEKPLAGITQITVTNFDGNTIRVTVTGEASLPVVELFDADEGLIFGVASVASATQQPQPDKPQTQTQPSQPSAQDDEPIELVVTGEQDGYRVPNASTATRTDTPIRDIPQSIQVVPQEVLQDRNVRTVTEALETVSGVVPIQLLGLPAGAGYIRGFEQPQQFRNGYRDNADRYGLTGIGTIEQVEVLKGPASVLFGAVEPGGIVNIVTKQPLSEPFYQLAFEAGNRSFYQPSLDFSGPLNVDKTLLYRFNVSYQSSDSFQDFVTKDFLTIAPTITWKLGDRTALNLYYEYLDFSGAYDSYHFLASDGTKPPRNRFLGYPDFAFNDKTTQRYGYTLQHEFSDNWQIRNNFSAVNSDTNEVYFSPTNLSNNRNLSLTAFDAKFTQDNYFAQIDLLGKFKTGSISHQLLVGFDFSHRNDTYEFARATVPDLDVFNPNYDIPKPNFSERVPFLFPTIQRYGVYLQDQIAFLDNLKLLIGGRLDWISQEVENTSEQNDFAFSPRVGLVYQPSQSVSLYGSYSQSFNPAYGVSQSGDTFEPTKGTQYEAGIKADFLEGRLSTTLAAYQITKTNVTTPVPGSSPPVSTQTGEQRSRGIELDITGEILPGWKVTAAYAYTNAEVTEDNVIPIGNRLQNVPENQASLWTTYFIQKGALEGLGFGLGLFYVGDRQGDLDNSFAVGDYLRTDAAIYYRRDRFNAAINIRNLFDTDYFGVSDGGRIYIRRGEPLTIIGSISWTF